MINEKNLIMAYKMRYVDDFFKSIEWELNYAKV